MVDIERQKNVVNNNSQEILKAISDVVEKILKDHSVSSDYINGAMKVYLALEDLIGDPNFIELRLPERPPEK